MHINKFIIKSVRDMLSLDIIKLALLTGVPLFLIWLGIGYLLWEPMVEFTSWIISWIPFSIVRANGAFIISFFIWFSAVLISYALFVGLFSGFLLGGKKESSFEAINFFIIFILSIFWSGVILYNWPWLSKEIAHLLTLLPFDTVAKGIAWLLAFYIFYNLFLISEYLVIFTFREPFIKALMEKHLGDMELKRSSHISAVFTYSKLYQGVLWFFVASFLILPVLFIPIANFLAVWFLWAWLYKESAFVGVCSMLCSKEDFHRLKEHKIYFISASLVAALLNFIPIISIFTPFFIMDLYFHWIISQREED